MVTLLEAWGEELPEKLDGGVHPTPQNPYPIYDQTLWFSPPYLWPYLIFNTLFMAVDLNIICEGLYLMVLSITWKRSFLKKHNYFKTKVQKPYPITNQNSQNQYPIYDQNDWKTIPLGAAKCTLDGIFQSLEVLSKSTSSGGDGFLK